MEERLQKILSRCGVASRRRAEELMAEGRVVVNGLAVRNLGARADLSRDDIRVDAIRVRPPGEPIYLLLNKPRGVVTTRRDPEGRTTVMDLVPPLPGLFPVGRLDVGTEGLILLTNDGSFAEKVAHPRYEVARVYHAKVRGVPEPKTLARLRKGIVIEGDRLAVDEVRILHAQNNTWLELTLHEGKQHEARRLLEGVGHPVSKLRRVGIGSLTARGLDPGEFRHLTPREVEAVLHPRRRLSGAEGRSRAGGRSRSPGGTRGLRRPKPGAGGRRERRHRESNAAGEESRARPRSRPGSQRGQARGRTAGRSSRGRSSRLRRSRP